MRAVAWMLAGAVATCAGLWWWTERGRLWAESAIEERPTVYDGVLAEIAEDAGL